MLIKQVKLGFDGKLDFLFAIAKDKNFGRLCTGDGWTMTYNDSVVVYKD